MNRMEVRPPVQFLTATAAHPLSWPTVLILAVVAALLACGYVAACVIWPFSACGRCDGSGKRRSPSGKAWRSCRRCRGSGARLRVGRRWWNHVRQMRKDAS